jgi:hypothetical protein
MKSHYQVQTKSAQNLEQLSNKQKQDIKVIILFFKNDPIPFKKIDICKLKSKDNEYTIKTETLRIVYEVLLN